MVPAAYRTVIDSGFFHIFSGDEERKKSYACMVYRLLKAGGTLYRLTCRKIQQEEPGVPLAEVHETFAEGWKIERVTEFNAETVAGAAEARPGSLWTGWLFVITKK